MGDRLERLAARRIAEDDGAEALPVEPAVRAHDVRTERVDDRLPGRRPGLHDLARQEVGVDEPAPQLHELPAHGGLPGRDPAGEAHEEEGAGRRGHRSGPFRDQSGRRNSPRATVTAEPPTSTRSIAAGPPSARAKSTLGRPISTPWRISISCPKGIRPWRARWQASGPAAEPVAGSSGTPAPGAKARVFQRRPAPAKQFVVPRGNEARQRLEIRLEGRDLRFVPERDAEMARPIVIELHGQHAPLDPERAEERRGVRDRLDAGHGLDHPSEHDPGAVPLDPDGHRADAGLEDDLRQLERRRQDEGGPQHRVPGERELVGGGEDPDAHVAGAARRVAEDGLRQMHLPGEGQEEGLRDPPRVREDGERIALEGSVREDVADHVAELGHHSLPRGRSPPDGGSLIDA